jgi:putative salt-induced outer membrane protein
MTPRAPFRPAHDTRPPTSSSRPRLARGRAALAAFALAAAPAVAAAQDAPAVPQSTLKDEKATTGETNVTSDKAVATDLKGLAESKDATELSTAAGALLSSGNARLVALTASGKFRLRRGENQVSAAAAVNYARAAPSPDESLRTTVENVQGLARYDRFLHDVALFVQAQGRRNRFQGLDLRLNVDPGAGYYFLNEKDTLLWVEAGYDLLFDVRRDEARVPPGPDGEPDPAAPRLDKTQAVHSARLFAGYELALDTGFKLSTGLEYLQGLAATNTRPGQSATEIYRLNGTLNAQAKVYGNLSMSLAFTGRYDHGALPGKEKLDTITSANLVYTLL